jgi:hypothetical protein
LLPWPFIVFLLLQVTDHILQYGKAGLAKLPVCLDPHRPRGEAARAIANLAPVYHRAYRPTA